MAHSRPNWQALTLSLVLRSILLILHYTTLIKFAEAHFRIIVRPGLGSSVYPREPGYQRYSTFNRELQILNHLSTKVLQRLGFMGQNSLSLQRRLNCWANLPFGNYSDEL